MFPIWCCGGCDFGPAGPADLELEHVFRLYSDDDRLEEQLSLINAARSPAGPFSGGAGPTAVSSAQRRRYGRNRRSNASMPSPTQASRSSCSTSWPTAANPAPSKMEGPCWSAKHGHSVPLTRKEHYGGILHVIRRIKECHPHVTIECHDRVTGGATDFLPLYYQHGAAFGLYVPPSRRRRPYHRQSALEAVLLGHAALPTTEGLLRPRPIRRNRLPRARPLRRRRLRCALVLQPHRPPVDRTITAAAGDLGVTAVHTARGAEATLADEAVTVTVDIPAMAAVIVEINVPD